MKKISILLFVIFMMLSIVGCTNITENKIYDYSDSELQMPTYAYTPPPVRDGINYQTKERYQEYHDAGLNILLLQSDDGYDGENWDTSSLKSKMDIATAAGNNKIIMFDERFYRLCNFYDKGLIGSESFQYSTEQDLDNYISNCVKDYSRHESFYGIQLKDEPSYHQLKCMGDLYKSLKRILPDAFIQINLLPANEGAKSSYCINSSTKELAQCYKEYLLTFLECSNANYIMFDSYPLKSSGVRSDHFITLDVASEVSKEKKVDVYAVAQTFSHISNGSLKTRICSEADLYWQTNLYMGFGIKQISYFNYWKKLDSSTESFNDYASFISNDGKKTDIYGYMKNINAEMQNIAKVILNFDYVGSKVFASIPSDYSTSYLNGLTSSELNKIKDVQIGSNDAALVTELFDSEHNNYIYMVQNILDDSLNRDEENETVLDITVEFKNTKHNKLMILNKGNEQLIDITENKYSLTLTVGQAVYILPY